MILGGADKTDYYRPQRSCEGYVFTRVCDSVHGGGGAIPAYIAGGIPAVGGGACSRGVPAPGVSAPGGCLLWGVPAPGGCLLGEGGVETPPKQAATVADGTHPTGMHSC